MKFTNRAVKALQATGERYEISETNGRGLRLQVSPTGAKTFVYVFRRGGKLNRLTLGAVGHSTLNDACATHMEPRKRALERPGGSEASRDRILTEAEIRQLWERLDTAVYDRHDYDDEKRDALELWAARVQAIIKHS